MMTKNSKISPQYHPNISPENFKYVFDYFPVPLFLIDPQGLFLDVNAAFTDMLGHDAKDICGKSFSDIAVKPGHFEKIEEGVRQDILNFELYYLKLAENKPMSFTVFNKSGNALTVLLGSVIDRDQDNNITSALGIITQELKPAPEPTNTVEDPELQRIWELERHSATFKPAVSRSSSSPRTACAWHWMP